MGKRDREQRKKKDRRDRIRRAKHQQHYGPEAGPDDELELPPETATERMLWEWSRRPSLFGRLRGLLFGRPESSSRDRAQELAFDALEDADPVAAVALARRALALDPDCSDALYVLALDARTPAERLRLLGQAVAAAERTLGGPQYIEANRGHFWGLLETRPYMRARAALADVLRGEDRVDEAVRHYAALLDLNPNDNQGLRDVLLGCYLRTGDLDGARGLLARYAGEPGAVFGYGRVLERFLSGDPAGAADALQEVRRWNLHVEAYLTGRRRVPGVQPGYYTPGDENEAVHCAAQLLDAWVRHPEAVAWLKGRPA